MTLTVPRRVQLSRQRGWRMPPNTRRVSRPGKYGNPYHVRGYWTPAGVFVPGLGAVAAVASFRTDLEAGRLSYTIDDVRAELVMLNLACWCSLDQPCHADVLLEVANA